MGRIRGAAEWAFAVGAFAGVVAVAVAIHSCDWDPNIRAARSNPMFRDVDSDPGGRDAGPPTSRP